MDRTQIIPHDGKHTLVYARNNQIMTGTVHLFRDENGEEKERKNKKVLKHSAVPYMIKTTKSMKL